MVIKRRSLDARVARPAGMTEAGGDDPDDRRAASREGRRGVGQVGRRAQLNLGAAVDLLRWLHRGSRTWPPTFDGAACRSAPAHDSMLAHGLPAPPRPASASWFLSDPQQRPAAFSPATLRAVGRREAASASRNSLPRRLGAERVIDREQHPVDPEPPTKAQQHGRQA